MKYFKNIELANLYNVSEKSVRNWIQSAKDGKLDLQLDIQNGRPYVANTLKNIAIIEDQVKKGKKYKNTRGFKIISPRPAFYKVYSDQQILNIISSLTIHHETPLQYTYVDGGAADWNLYANRLLEDQTPNILTRTLEILEASAKSLNKLLEDYEKVNIVDLGPGNGLPIRSTLERFMQEGRLNRYIPIDISKDMLTILEKNIKTWFGDSIQCEPQLKDVSYERFDDCLAKDFGNDKIVNLVFLMGGTLANFRSPGQILEVINSSLGLNDVFIYNGYLDTPKTRRYFDYYTSDKKVPVQDGIILDFLNIDESLYDVEQVFNEQERARTISIRPKIDLAIRFDLANGSRTIELPKNEPILIWRHWHKSLIETVDMLDKSGFDIMQATKSIDLQYAVLITKMKVENRQY
ncbi:MAG TPA: L-histidine N(alpha)-methyltransferase [Nevskiaceae bacterium]|nr:L-histidine N(alpha)-methyltransferase [Nevskiaceae bacterium]